MYKLFALEHVCVNGSTSSSLSFIYFWSCRSLSWSKIICWIPTYTYRNPLARIQVNMLNVVVLSVTSSLFVLSTILARTYYMHTTVYMLCENISCIYMWRSWEKVDFEENELSLWRNTDLKFQGQGGLVGMGTGWGGGCRKISWKSPVGPVIKS